MRVRDLLFRNLSAKIFSLFFALVLWGVVIGEKQAQIQLNIPLEIVNIPEKTAVVSDVPASLSVIVQGPRTMLRTLPGRGIRKSIDLKGMGLGWTTMRILPDSISLPRGAEVVRLTPSTVDLKLEPLEAMELPVTPQLVGEPPKGYRIQEIKVDPPKVLLKGGQSELSRLSEIKTHTVTITQATTDLEEKVGLNLEGLHPAGVSPPQVWVRVKLAPNLTDRTLEEIPVKISPQGGRALVRPEKVKVFLKGPAEVVDGLKGMDVEVNVSLDGLKPGSHKVAPKASAPSGIRVVKVEPSIIEVTLE